MEPIRSTSVGQEEHDGTDHQHVTQVHQTQRNFRHRVVERRYELLGHPREELEHINTEMSLHVLAYNMKRLGRMRQPLRNVASR